jgi:hypothetical protein
MHVYPSLHRSRIISGAAVGCLALLLAAPGPIFAQSLAEVAKKEAERRKAVKGEAKVLTNKDLTGAPPPAGIVTPAPPAPAAGQAPAPGETDPSQEPESQQKDEKYWRQRITEARERLAQGEILQAALESRLNALATDFVNRDDPAQRATITSERQKAQAQLDRTKKDIENHKKEIADIQDEARKAGVPPGWLR